MKPRYQLRICAATLWLALSGPHSSLYGQTDGAYCVGPSYLAYERARPLVYDSVHGAIPPRHVLHLLRMDSAGTVAMHVQIELPTFTVHGMQCLSSHVGILGWDSLYTVEIAGSPPYSVNARSAPWAAQGSSRLPLHEYPDSTLWHGWSVSQVTTVPLPLTAHNRHYALRITARETSPQKCLYRVLTQLVPLGAVRSSQSPIVLYDEVRHGECGE